MATAIVYGTDDVHISQLGENTNFEGDVMQVGFLVTKLDSRGLMRADLGAYIPVGSTITQAELWIDIISNAEHDNDAYYGYRCLRNWAAAGATWNDYNAGVWGTAGCKLLNTDYETAEGFGPFSWNGTGWKAHTITSFVQADWAADRIFNLRFANHAAVAEDETANITFHATGTAHEWYIRVTYTPPAGGEGSRNRGHVIGSRLGGLHLPDLPRGWMRRRGLVLPVGC